VCTSHNSGLVGKDKCEVFNNEFKQVRRRRRKGRQQAKEGIKAETGERKTIFSPCVFDEEEAKLSPDRMCAQRQKRNEGRVKLIT
jgi:hypothetical protein